MQRCPDIGRARECLGWEPRVGLDEGLGRIGVRLVEGDGARAIELRGERLEPVGATGHEDHLRARLGAEPGLGTARAAQCAHPRALHFKMAQEARLAVAAGAQANALDGFRFFWDIFRNALPGLLLEGMAGRYGVIINGPKVPGPVPTSQLLSLADERVRRIPRL